MQNLELFYYSIPLPQTQTVFWDITFWFDFPEL